MEYHSMFCKDNSSREPPEPWHVPRNRWHYEKSSIEELKGRWRLFSGQPFSGQGSTRMLS
jgi:hypothetical protein